MWPVTDEERRVRDAWVEVLDWWINPSRLETLYVHPVQADEETWLISMFSTNEVGIPYHNNVKVHRTCELEVQILRRKIFEGSLEANHISVLAAIEVIREHLLRSWTP